MEGVICTICGEPLDVVAENILECACGAIFQHHTEGELVLLQVDDVPC